MRGAGRGNGEGGRGKRKPGSGRSDTAAPSAASPFPLPPSLIQPHPLFTEALAAFDAGDIERLRKLLAENPDLVHARTNLEPPYHYFTGATLLHHVAGNPGRARLPDNVVAIAQLLLQSGSDVNALTLGKNGGTTMGLVITSKQASDRNVSGPLIDLLLQHGAKLDLADTTAVIPEWADQYPLDLPLANYASRAAEKMIELGAVPDVCAWAALGRLDMLRDSFDRDGHLKSFHRRGGRIKTEHDAVGLAMLFAYVNKRLEAVDFLLEKDGNWNMIGVNNGTALHRAAWEGDLSMIERLVQKGADIGNRDNPFVSTPLSWAQHNRQAEVFDWMRKNCKIDIHDAVGFDLREHVEARLREDPSSVNRVLDQWDIPRCTPLHWAVWPYSHDVAGKHPYDLAVREQLVRLLLERGADPNVVAGNGATPLDVAIAGGAERLADVVRQHGGKRAEEL
ncbi:MAG: ankyrin repeat domain-containing protein [Gemmatimonadaceae bacterium]